MRMVLPARCRINVHPPLYCYALHPESIAARDQKLDLAREQRRRPQEGIKLRTLPYKACWQSLLPEALLLEALPYEAPCVTPQIT